MMVVVYYLAIKNFPVLESVFPEFSIWALTVIGIGVPLAMFLGWLHVKRSPAFRSEVEIMAESNPYYYKLHPGYQKEIIAPLYLELLSLNLMILNKEQLTEKEHKKVKELQKRLQFLIEGGRIGGPESREKVNLIEKDFEHAT